jgi:hypothetical protein
MRSDLFERLALMGDGSSEKERVLTLLDVSSISGVMLRLQDMAPENRAAYEEAIRRILGPSRHPSETEVR